MVFPRVGFHFRGFPRVNFSAWDFLLLRLEPRLGISAFVVDSARAVFYLCGLDFCGCLVLRVDFSASVVDFARELFCSCGWFREWTFPLLWLIPRVRFHASVVGSARGLFCFGG